MFEKIGVFIEPAVLIVGVRRPESKKNNPICIEPEDEQWSIDIFTGLLDNVEEIFKIHPLQDVVYDNLIDDDERSNDEKPEVKPGARHLVTLVIRKILASSAYAIEGTLTTMIDRLEKKLPLLDALQDYNAMDDLADENNVEDADSIINTLFKKYR